MGDEEIEALIGNDDDEEEEEEVVVDDEQSPNSISMSLFDLSEETDKIDERDNISIEGLQKEEPAQWLVEANKKIKEEKKAARNKKKLVNDWRFWLACVAGAGFVSALFTVQPWKNNQIDSPVANQETVQKLPGLRNNNNDKSSTEELIL